MNVTLTLKEKATHCYKYDEVCCGCPSHKIMGMRLAVVEVSGRIVQVEADRVKKQGFMCDECVDDARKNIDFTIIIG